MARDWLAKLIGVGEILLIAVAVSAAGCASTAGHGSEYPSPADTTGSANQSDNVFDAQLLETPYPTGFVPEQVAALKGRYAVPTGCFPGRDTLLAYSYERACIVGIRPTTGVVTEISKRLEWTEKATQVGLWATQGGELVAVLAVTEGQLQIAIVNTVTGQVVSKVLQGDSFRDCSWSADGKLFAIGYGKPVWEERDWVDTSNCQIATVDCTASNLEVSGGVANWDTKGDLVTWIFAKKGDSEIVALCSVQGEGHDTGKLLRVASVYPRRGGWAPTFHCQADDQADSWAEISSKPLVVGYDGLVKLVFDDEKIFWHAGYSWPDSLKMFAFTVSGVRSRLQPLSSSDYGHRFNFSYLLPNGETLCGYGKEDDLGFCVAGGNGQVRSDFCPATSGSLSYRHAQTIEGGVTCICEKNELRIYSCNVGLWKWLQWYDKQETGQEAAPPYLEAAVKAEVHDGSIVLELTCSNQRGRGALYQVFATVELGGARKVVCFGKVLSGESASREVKIPLSELSQGRSYAGSIRWHECNDEVPAAPTRFEVDLDALPSPVLSYSYRVVDDESRGGNADGRLQVGELADLELTIINLGSAKAANLRASLQGEDGSTRVYEGEDLALGSLNPSASISRVISIKVMDTSSKSAVLRLRALESSQHVSLDDVITIPIDQNIAAQVILLNRKVWLKTGATIRSGAAGDTSVLGRVEAPVYCEATGRLEGWYRIKLDSGETGWVKDSEISDKAPDDVVESGSTKSGGVVRIYQKQPPIIVMLAPGQEKFSTTLEGMQFAGAITDDTGIKSVEVKVNGELKLKGGEKGIEGVANSDAVVQPGPAEATADRLPFVFTLPLEVGLNKVEIIATDKDGQTAKETFEITRETVRGRFLVLCVGVSDYNDPKISDLASTEKDAKAVYDFFASNPHSPAEKEDCKLLLGKDASAQNIKATLQTHLINQARPEDTVIFYYSGHGFADGDTFYMIPQDTQTNALAATAIALDEFQRLWSKVQAERRIFITDACNSGGFTGLRDPEGAAAKGYELLGKGSAVLTASSGTETALDSKELGHGVYTYYLLKALKGEKDDAGKLADADSNGKVSIKELHEYCYRNVPDRARRTVAGHRQTPSAKIDVSGEVALTR